MKYSAAWTVLILGVSVMQVNTAVGQREGYGKGYQYVHDYSDQSQHSSEASSSGVIEAREAETANITRSLCRDEFEGCQSVAQTNSGDKPVVTKEIRNGPRYDVTQFGAVGDGAADDTTAIQAAFDACWNHGTGIQPYGGIVEFPGTHTYVVRETINAHDTCRIEGSGTSLRQQSPPELRWRGKASGTTELKLTEFRITHNTSSIKFVESGNVKPGDTLTINGTLIKFVASGAAGDEVNIGRDGAATATALCKLLNQSSDQNLKKSKPYINSSSGVIESAWQSIGYVETVSTTSPAIKIDLALGTRSVPKSGRAEVNEYLATFPAINNLAAGDWVFLQGFTADGVVLNRTVAQVAAASGSSFTVALPFTPFVPLSGSRVMNGSYIDTGSATTTSVVLAFDTWSRSQQEVSNLMLTGSPAFGVGIYFGSRIDSGSRALNTWVEGAKLFGYYFSSGGINVEIGKGSRCDGAGMACMYWRATAGDNFRLADSTFNVSVDGNGAAVMLDASSCGYGVVDATLSHLTLESDQFSIAPGLGIITLYDCGPNIFLTQFFLNLDNVYESETNAVTNPGLVMSPANDSALQITAVNSSFNGQTPAKRWVGVAALARNDMLGKNGYASLLNYSAPVNSLGPSTYGENISGFRAPTQLISDLDINQLWQYGIQASTLLHSDTSFTSVPNGTTVFAGQILAPPEFWGTTNGIHHALYVVYQTGTTGRPNAGKTKCSGKQGQSALTCSSATDLSIGQRLTLGAETGKTIKYINATVPDSVSVRLTSGLSASHVEEDLTFTAPLLSPDIQLPAKAARPPADEAWARGDLVQNSSAKTNGIAGWVSVAAGKPDGWAGIPLGNAQGQIDPSQISGTTGSGNVVLSTSPSISGLNDTGNARFNNVTISGVCHGCSGKSIRTAQFFCMGTAKPSSTLVMSGGGGAGTSCTSEAGGENASQLLMTTDGTISDLVIRCGSSGIGPASGVFSIWDSPSGISAIGVNAGARTGLSVTYGKTNANTAQFDSAHTFSYAKGDLLRIQFTTQANETLGNCEASFNY